MVERAVLLIFGGEMVFVSKNKVFLGSEVCLVRQNNVIPIDFSYRNGGQKG